MRRNFPRKKAASEEEEEESDSAFFAKKSEEATTTADRLPEDEKRIKEKLTRGELLDLKVTDPEKYWKYAKHLTLEGSESEDEASEQNEVVAEPRIKVVDMVQRSNEQSNKSNDQEVHTLYPKVNKEPSKPPSKKKFDVLPRFKDRNAKSPEPPKTENLTWKEYKAKHEKEIAPSPARMKVRPKTEVKSPPKRAISSIGSLSPPSSALNPSKAIDYVPFETFSRQIPEDRVEESSDHESNNSNPEIRPEMGQEISEKPKRFQAGGLISSQREEYFQRLSGGSASDEETSEDNDPTPRSSSMKNTKHSDVQDRRTSTSHMPPSLKKSVTLNEGSRNGPISNKSMADYIQVKSRTNTSAPSNSKMTSELPYKVPIQSKSEPLFKKMPSNPFQNEAAERIDATSRRSRFKSIIHETIFERTRRDRAQENKIRKEPFERDPNVIERLREFGIGDQKRLLAKLTPQETSPSTFGGFLWSYFSPILRAFIPTNFFNRYRSNSATSDSLKAIDISRTGTKTENLQIRMDEKLDERKAFLRESMGKVAMDQGHLDYLLELADNQPLALPITVSQDLLTVGVQAAHHMYKSCLEINPFHKLTKYHKSRHAELQEKLLAFNRLCDPEWFEVKEEKRPDIYRREKTPSDKRKHLAEIGYQKHHKKPHVKMVPRRRPTLRRPRKVIDNPMNPMGKVKSKATSGSEKPVKGNPSSR